MKKRLMKTGIRKAGKGQALWNGLMQLAAATLLVVPVGVQAVPVAREDVQAAASKQLFPFYSASDMLGSVRLHHHAALASVLLSQLGTLESLATDYCAGRGQIVSLQNQADITYRKWLELSAVAWGPLLTHNTVRQIDFRPLRINQLERAISKQLGSQQDMNRIGSPAKGFPALEHLFHTAPMKAGTPECAYSLAVIRDIQQAVSRLDWQVAETPGSPGKGGNEAGRNASSEEGSNTAGMDQSGQMKLYFNQLLGAVHSLGWESIEKPFLKKLDQSAGAEKPAVKALEKDSPVVETSFAVEDQWAAKWHALENLLVIHGDAVPDPNRQAVPLEAYLRGLGQVGLADELSQRTHEAQVRIGSAKPAMPDTVKAAAQALKQLKSFLEQDVARGLKVPIQFSSSDGD